MTNELGGYTREALLELCLKATTHLGAWMPATPEFIAAARTALPAALQRIAELEQERRENHQVIEAIDAACANSGDAKEDK